MPEADDSNGGSPGAEGAGGGAGAPGGARSPLLTGPHLWHVRWVRDLGLIGLGLFLIWFGFKLRSIFTPVLVGLFLAYFLHPLISWAERKRVPRPASISGILLLLFGAIAGVGLWLGPALARQTIELASNLADHLEAMAARLQAQFGVDFGGLTEGLNRFADKYREDPASAMLLAVRSLFAGGEAAGGWIGSALGTATYVIISVVLIPVYFFFFAWHFTPIVRGLERYIPVSRRDRVLHVLGRMDKAVAAFFRSRLLISLIMAALLWVGWWAIDVPYAFVMGLLGGLLNMIPYVGLIVWPMVIVLQWLQETGPEGAGFSLWMVLLWPSAVYLFVQGLESWLLTPWIQGKQLEMSPVTILIVVFIGGAVGGLYGLILSVPLAACLKILLEEIILPRMHHWASTH